MERELAPFVEAARAKAKAVEEGDKESELSDLRSSDFEGIEEDMMLSTILVKTGSNEGSRVEDNKAMALVSLALQMRPKRARLVPARYQS